MHQPLVGHNNFSTMMHFKKKWLQQERERAAAAAAAPVRYMNPDFSQETAAISRGSPLFPTFPISSAPKDPLSHTSERLAPPSDLVSHMGLNIPRFAKYSYTPAPLPSLRTQHSAVSSSVLSNPVASEPTGFHWIHAGRTAGSKGPSRAEAGGALDQKEEPRERSLRFMIDINKPPPSPTHSLESDVAPCTPISASPKDGLSSSPSFLRNAVEYSLSPSWLASAMGEKTSPVGLSFKSSPCSPLLHLPALDHQAPELSKAATAGDTGATAAPKTQRGSQGQSKSVEGQRKSSPVSVLARESSSTPSPLRKPRTLWASGDHAHGTQVRFTPRRVLDVSESHEGDSHPEDEEGDAEDEGFQREDSEEAGTQGEQGPGGTPKACLHCGTTRTPLWRNGPPGPKSLCNACGIRFNKIRSGKRKPNAKEASMLLKYDRCGSTSSGMSEVVSGGFPERSASLKQQQQQQLRDLPVATLHRSRSKLGGRHGSTLASRKRELEGEDPEEAKPLRSALYPGKRACVDSSEGRRAPSLLHGVRIQIARMEEDDPSSSEHESCLSEPQLSPEPESLPHSDVLWGEYAEEMPGSSAAAVPKAGKGSLTISHLGGITQHMEDSDGSDADVEAGAMLLMEIFNSSAAVSC